MIFIIIFINTASSSEALYKYYKVSMFILQSPSGTTISTTDCDSMTHIEH